MKGRGIITDKDRAEAERFNARLHVLQFAQEILHGDDEHKAWLLKAAKCYMAEEPLPPPTGGPAERFVCTGCGDRSTNEELKAGGHFSCCPERKMVTVEELWKLMARSERPPEVVAVEIVKRIDAANAHAFECDADREEAVGIVIEELAPQAKPPATPATPAARWRVQGIADPHDNRYDCERAALMMGDMTDDELANAVYLCDHRSSLSSISLLTATKDRIRWLSRSLEKALARLRELEGKPNLRRVRRVRHKKRGSTYEVLGEGEAQISTNFSNEYLNLGQGRVIVEGDKMIVYRCDADGKLWLRFPDEFLDGRFEDVQGGYDGKD